MVQKTLNWPNSFIKQIAIQQVRFNHPRIDDGQKVAIEDLEGWANRIFKNLNYHDLANIEHCKKLVQIISQSL